MLARDLRIGQTYGEANDGTPIKIKVLHELCTARPTPHVHVVTTQSAFCLAFTIPVSGSALRTVARNKRKGKNNA